MKKHSVPLTILFVVFVFLTVSCQTQTEKNKNKAVVNELTPYMHDLARANGGSFRMDLTDEKQHTFLKARLGMFGKNKENSSQLFKSINQVRTKQQQLKSLGKSTSYVVSTRNQSDVSGDPDNIDNNHHSVSQVVPSVIDSVENPNWVKSEVVSTVMNGTDMTYLDIVVMDEDGVNQLGNPDYIENYAEGTDVRVATASNYDLIKEQYPDLTAITVNSVQFNEINEEEEPPQFLLVTSVLPVASASTVNKQYLIDLPEDVNGDETVMLCLNRSHNDCDYPQFTSSTNDATYVRIPFRGKITYDKRILKIYDYNDPTYSDTVKDSQTGVYIYAKNLGGATVLDNFYDHLILKVDETNQVSTIYWNIPREEGVFENAMLYARYEQVGWFFKINIKFSASWSHNIRTLDAQFGAATKDFGVHPDDAFAMEPYLPPLMFAYSCIAAGTEIRLANGQLMAIENITDGMKIRANGEVLPVVDTSIGIENIPMYRITDQKGNSVLLTESHPVITLNHGIIWASEVEPGDRVKNEKGSALVTTVSKEMFDGNVYNLKLDISQIEKATARKVNAMFANGILVGDLDMQAAHEFKNEVDKKDVLSRLPKKWHQDYKNYIKSLGK